jgi:hypothetical protein
MGEEGVAVIVGSGEDLAVVLCASDIVVAKAAKCYCFKLKELSKHFIALPQSDEMLFIFVIQDLVPDVYIQLL